MRPPNWYDRVRSAFFGRNRRVPAPLSKLFEFRAYVETLEDRYVPATFTVLNTNDSGVGSLRDAVAQANANVGADSIVFGDGSGSGGTNFLDSSQDTITLTSGAITFTGDTALTTVTGPGAGLLSVSGGGTQIVFWIDAGISTSMSGMTVTNGNSPTTGGGVNNFGTLTMTDCTISGSSASSKGGGVANNSGGTAFLTNCTVSGNTAGYQGAGVQNSGTMTISHSTITGNTGAPSGGGGINMQGTSLNVVNTAISGNTSGGAGGGIAANNTVSLTGCTISGNTSGSSGGGILEYSSAMAVTDCTVTGNYAPSGGGVYMRFGSLNLKSVTISANTATSGGGISNTSGSGSLTFRNSIVSANSAPTGPDINGVLNTDSGYNLLGSALSGTTSGTGDVFSDTPLLSPLGSYGGPTQTVIPLAGSPALGAGDNSGGPATDQRGFSRQTGPGANIGAVEGNVYIVTTTADTGAGSLRNAVAAADVAASGDFIFFSSFFNSAQTISLTTGELDLTDAATTSIIGTGANLLSVSGNNASRVFAINASASLVISSLTITAGASSSTGGAVNNLGELTLTDCTISGSSSNGRGGGVYSADTLTMTGCTVTGNTATGTFGYGGGGFAFGTASLTNCTVSGNSATTGGGVQKGNGSSLTLTNDTISGNSATANGGGVKASMSGAFTIQNTIVAGNTCSAGPDVYAIDKVDSLGNNLIGKTEGSTGWAGSDLTGTVASPLDPQLAALADNGGATQTMALLAYSPAINAGNSAAAPATDQRGQTRFGNTDIGAYEYLFKVTDTTDSSNLGSLRTAITNANAIAGTDTIVFRIPGTGVQTIQPNNIGGGTALPVITDSVVIDGWSQGGPGYTGSPLIEIDGTNAGGTYGAFGLNIQASNTTVRGLAINRFPLVVGNGFGIGVFTAVSNIWIYGNYIGTDATGTAAAGNGQGGIWIGPDPTDVLIGTNADGTNDAAERNVISGNNGNGVIVQGSSNIIAGNYIGTNAAGTAAIGNTGSGVEISFSASDNTIGGVTTATRNVISGNMLYGVQLLNVGTTGNVVANNYIGTDATGTAALSNSSGGVLINGASGNFIGQPGAGNVLAASSGNGIEIYQADNNSVVANYIGIDATGTAPLGNAQGITIYGGSSNNIIGGTTAADRNIISANTTGVAITGATTTGNVVQGNYIGTNPAGTAASTLGNTTGVLVNAGAHDNTIGGTAGGAGNLISGNLGTGIEITDTGTSGNLVEGNIVGLAADGTTILGNTGSGIFLTLDANANVIGGTVAGAGNILSGNAAGIRITGGSSVNNVIQGNLIGTDVTGLLDRGNAGPGVSVVNADGTVVGGTTALARNVISGNAGNGIELLLSGTAGTIIRGNLIGLGKDGTTALGNDLSGIDIEGAANTTVGGDDATDGSTDGQVGARNVISANAQYGIRIVGDGATRAVGNVILGNYIGLDAGGMLDRGNALSGIGFIDRASNNTIGGTTAGAGNFISGNDENGILFTSPNVFNNKIEGNFIGTNAAGTAAVGNATGVSISNQAFDNTIGGTTAAARNVISGNARDGIRLSDTNTRNITVEGNYIGVNAAGTAALANDQAGVYVYNGVSNSTIGGTAVGASNVISGNTTYGVAIDDSSLITVAGNYIGTDPTGTTAIANATGVSIFSGSANNSIGTTEYGQSFVNGNAGLSGPLSITAAPGGDLYVSDEAGLGTDAIYRLNPTTGAKTLIAAGGYLNVSLLATDAAGRIVALAVGYNNGNAVVARIDPATGQQTLISDLSNPGQGPTVGSFDAGGLVVEPTGTYLITDGGNGRILRIDPATGTRTVLSSGGSLTTPTFLTLAPDGSLLVSNISDLNNTPPDGSVVRVDRTTGAQTVITSGGFGFPSALAVAADGSILLTDRGPTTDTAADAVVYRIDPATGARTIAASGGLLENLYSVVVMADGSVVVVDRGAFNGLNAGNGLIRLTPGGARNVISGNTGNGVDITNSVFGAFTGDTSQNAVFGNYIGVDVTGLAALPNLGAGVTIYASGDNTIGGMSAGAGNVVSGNGAGGIVLTGSSSNTIADNLIGVGNDGARPVANTGDGLSISDLSIPHVGHFFAEGNNVAGNVVSANTQAGVHLTGTGTDSNVVAGNFIGTDAAGTDAIGNATGVQIDSGANNNTIGGTSAGARNIISGNTGDGVQITGTGTNTNTILGNYIGTDATGQTAIGNGTGVTIDFGATNNTIGTTEYGSSVLSNITQQQNAFGLRVATNGDIYTATSSDPLIYQNFGVVRINPVTGAQTVITRGGGQDGPLQYPGDLAIEAGGTIVVTDLNAGAVSLGIVRVDPTTGVQTRVSDFTNPGQGPIITYGIGIVVEASGDYIVASGNDNTLYRVNHVTGDRTVLSSGAQLDHPYGLAIDANGNILSTNGSGGTSQIVRVNPTNGAQSVVSGGFEELLFLTVGADGSIYATDAGNGSTVPTAVYRIDPVTGAKSIISTGPSDGLFYNGIAIETGGSLITGFLGTISGDPQFLLRLTPGAARNVISGNTSDGVQITGSGTNTNSILGNYIGTTADGLSALGNTGSGVFVNAGATGTLIGGNVAGAGNVISGSVTANGVAVSDAGTDGTVIQGNFIGTDKNGTAAVPNFFPGVAVVNGATNTLVGGLTAAPGTGAGNVISGNKQHGVMVRGTGTNGTVIQGNLVGLVAGGTAKLGNGTTGAYGGVAVFDGATNTTIGGTNPQARNVVSGNENLGIVILGSGGLIVAHTIIQGNFVGTDVTGTFAIPNGRPGIGILDQTANVTIGGTAAGAGNLISGNAGGGVIVANLFNTGAPTGVVVQGNLIGTNATATGVIPNTVAGTYLGTGVEIRSASNVVVGGVAAGAANVIRGNLGAGVSVTGATSTGNTIRGNSIYSNGGLGIDLGGDGVTANDKSGHAGPNNYQNYPVLNFVGSGATTTPKGLLNAAPNTTYTIDFYASSSPDASGFGEGQRYLGSSTVTTNAVGQAIVSVTLGVATAPSDWISVTTTDPSGNTSEFGQSLQADVPPAVTLSSPTQALVGVTLPFTPVLTDTVPGKTYQYAWTVTFNGSPIALPNASYVSNGATNQETFFFTPQRVGTYVVSVTVTDSRGGVTTAVSNAIGVTATTLGITITGNPLGTPVPFAVNTGQPVTLTNRISDPRPSTIDPKTGAAIVPSYSYTWSVTRNGLAFSLPVGTVTTASTFTFTPTGSGLYLVSLAVADGTYAAGADSVSLYDTAAPAAQIIVSPGTAVTAGTRVNLQTVVTDVALRRGLTYSWTITPDNGQPVISATNSTGVYAFTATAAGNYVVSVSVTDDQHRSGVSPPVKIRVGQAAPRVTIYGAPITASPGAPLTLTGSATDADPNQPGSGSANVYTLSWNASTTAGTITPATGTGGTYIFTPSAAGTVVVNLTATDQNGIKTSVPVVINVAPPAATLTVTPPANPTQGQLLTWSASLSPVVPGTTYSWSVFSPDGITRTFNTGTSNSLTLPETALPGRYDVSVTATANGYQYTTAAPAAGTFVVVPHAPVVVSIATSSPIPPQTSLQEGDKVTLTGTATEPGVDLTNLSKASYLWTVTGPSGFSQVGVLPSLTFTPLVAGTYTATLAFRDFTGGSGSATTTIAVTHVTPKLLLKYQSTAADGTMSFQAVVANSNNHYSYTYSVQLNGQSYIQSTPGGSAFSFRIPPIAAPTRITVSVIDSASATGQITATVQSIAAGTAATPVQKTVLPADLLAGTNVAVVLAQGYNRIYADPSLPTTATVEFIAVGGHNAFFGGPSVNIFQGDSGSNAMTGGTGPNTFFASGNDSLFGGAGSNLYVPVTVDNSSGNALNVTAGSGANTFDLSQQYSVSLDLTATGSAQTFDSLGNQVVLNGSFQSVLGSGGADTLTAASGASISGGGGNDLLKSNNANNVTLSAESGLVTLQATGGSNVMLLGGKDTNLVTATNVTNASLIGGSGNNDSLLAGLGSLNVSLIGGSGNNDTLVALGGNISLMGGSGNNDSLVAGLGGTNVSLIGGSGNNDSLIALGGSVSLIGGSGNNASLVAGAGSANVSLIGGSGNNDSLIALGGSSNVSLIGGSGNNASLLAGAGSTNVSLVGGSGNNDSLIALGGSVSLIGGSGNNASLVAGAGSVNVSLVGGSGNNASLVAGAGSVNVSLVGGSGNNDSLIAIGGSSSVSLIGGSGNNASLVAGLGSTNISLIGGSGANDSLLALGANISLIGGSGNNASLVAGAGSVNVSLVGGSGNNDSLVALGGSANVSLIGGSGNNDSLVALGGNVSLIGGSGNNASLVAMGGSSNVSLIGGSGSNDSLIAGAGAVNVSLVGGSGGNDSLVALDGSANVSLIGGSGNNDTLIAGVGSKNVSLVGGSGNNDSLFAGASSVNVTLVGGSGNNASLVTGPGSFNVSLIGGSGNNGSLIATGGTNVSLIGGSGDGTRISVTDTAGAILLGGMGANLSLSASGTSNNVVLIGGFGNGDSLTAGAGVSGAELVGGFGNNDYVEATGVNNSVLVGGFGDNDSLVASGSNNVTLLGGYGNNSYLKRVGGTNSYLIGQSGNNDSLISSGGGTNVSLVGGSGDGLFLSDTGSNNVSLLGGSGQNDTVISVNGTNATVFGGNGNNDSVYASGGANVFAIGGTGSGGRITTSKLTNSTVLGGAGNSNAITNSNGTNVLVVGGSGIANVLTDLNGIGNTLVNGGNQLASLVASGGNSVRLFGGGGTDYLSATGGTNIGLFGENGDNTYYISGTAANPFSGYVDALGTIGLEQSTTDQLESGTNTLIFPTADVLILDLSLALGGAATASAAAAATQQVATGTSFYLIGLFSGVVGSATGNDYITGNALPNSLVAGAGNATLVAGAGDATLVAGAGNDSLVGGGRTTFAFRGAASGSHTVSEADPNDSDVIDLSQLTAPTVLNLAATSNQAVTSTLSIRITNPTIPDVIGSPYGNTLTGNVRDNHFTLSSANNNVVAGSGLTTLKFTGKTLGTNTITAPTPSSVVLNLHQLGQPVSINLSQPIQSIAGGTIFFVSASDSRAVASVVGTIFGDVLVGDSAVGAPGVSLFGGGGRDSLVGGAGNDFLQAGVPQVVLLDFDTFTPLSPGNHVYTQYERDAIQQRMQGVFSAFSSTVLDGSTVYSNGFVFTQSLATAQLLTRSTGGEFVTMYFNEPPVGGQAEEVDFANANLGGTASVDASLILGAANQPDPTTINFINESAGLAEHELGHLVGLRHTDAFGPIGSGAYQVFLDGTQVSGLNPSAFYPYYQQPTTAQPILASTDPLLSLTSIPDGATAYGYETPLHVMGSPASIGISRFDTLNDIFFGEREAMRLAFDQSGVILLAQTAPHDSAASAQDLGVLPGLVVPNTSAAGSLNAGQSFSVSAVAVVGSIGLDGSGRSRSDWYSFSAHAGDVMSFETISNVLPGNSRPLDTILRVYDAAGNLLASNDDELESRDSLIQDFRVPADGKYSVQVDTYAQDPAENTSQGDYVLYMTNFKIGPSGGGGSTLVAGAGNDVLYGGQGNNLFRLISNNAVHETVIGGNGADVLDRTAAPFAMVTVLTPSQNTSISQLLGTPPALQFPTGLSNQSITKGGLLHFSASVTNAGRSVTYSLFPVTGGLTPVGATIRSTDGDFNWSAGDQGTYEIGILATASDGATATTTVTIVVSAVAPALAPLATQTDTVGTAIALDGSVVNPVLTDTYTYVWTITLDNQTVATLSGRDVSFNPGVSGSYTSTLSVTDQQDGLSSTTSATLNVTDVAPVVAPLSAVSINEGDSTSFTGLYSYPGNTTSLLLSWTVTNAVNQIVGSGTGPAFTFTAPDADIYSVTFKVQTASGLSRSATALVTAAGVLPTATPPAGTSIAEGTSTTLTFTDPFSPASAVTAEGFRYSFALSSTQLTATYAASGTSPSLSFFGNDAGSYTVYGRIIDKNDDYRDYVIQVVVVDVQIVPVGMGPFSSTKQATTGPITVATFTDAGGPEPVSSYSATIDWGDGTVPTVGTIGAPVNGVYPVIGMHTYATQGIYTIRTILSHDSLPALTVTDAMTVTAPALVGTGGLSLAAVKAEDTGSLILATFTDSTGPDDLGTYAATIDWGDGTTSDGTINPTGTTYTVRAGHTYATIGAKTVTVTLKHQGSADATVTDSATVVNPALVGLGAGIAATRNTPTGQITVAMFTDPGGPDALANYTATINWGDGSSTSTGTIALGDDGRTFSVLGEHTYSAAALYPIIVTVTHLAASPIPPVMLSISSTATVANPAVSPTFSPFTAVLGVPLTNQMVATFFDPSGADAAAAYAATINWGDGTATTVGTIGPPVNGTFPVTGSHTYNALGNYPVTITVVHGSSPTASTSGTATVIGGPVNATGGYTRPVASAIPSSPIVATFTDPFGAVSPSGYTATINWGDGNSSTGTITGPVNGGFSVSGTHTYFDLGNVPITVTIARWTAFPVTVTSTASVGTSIIALNPTLSGSVALSGSPTITIAGSLVIDSSSSTALTASGSPVVSAGSIGIVGGYSTSGSPHITPTPITHVASLADPLAGLPIPANPGGTVTSANITGSSTVTLNPGRYSKIAISGSAKVTLNPGVYVISGGGLSVSGSATLTGNGVLIYVAGSNYPNAGGTFGGISFSGSPHVTLTPASTGTYAGITLFQARDNNLAITFSGSAQSGINGFLYAQKALVNLSGSNTTVRMGIIADRLNTSGSSTSGVVSAGTGTEDGTPAGEFLSTSLYVYVQDPLGHFTAAERDRIHDALVQIDGLVAPFGVDVTEVSDPNAANLVIDSATTTPLGGMAEGVLAVYDPSDSEITLVEGWTWYDGPTTSSVPSSQFDFQTAVVHELGHALGLGHLPDPASVMYESLPTGTAKRSLLTSDLNIGNEHGLPGALHADLGSTEMIVGGPQPVAVSTSSPGAADLSIDFGGRATAFLSLAVERPGMTERQTSSVYSWPLNAIGITSVTSGREDISNPIRLYEFRSARSGAATDVKNRLFAPPTAIERSIDLAGSRVTTVLSQPNVEIKNVLAKKDDFLGQCEADDCILLGVMNFDGNAISGDVSRQVSRVDPNSVGWADIVLLGVVTAGINVAVATRPVEPLRPNLQRNRRA
ncbi:MAG TPA: choice-of-anchor Q domain-containing protein [Fimbriiglobus sp.]